MHSRVPTPDGSVGRRVVWENPVLNQNTSITCLSSVASIDLVNNVSYCQVLRCVNDYFLERIPYNCSMQQPLSRTLVPCSYHSSNGRVLRVVESLLQGTSMFSRGWLRYENGRMYCKTCDTAAQKGHKLLPSNNFVASKGNANFRLTTMARHEEGNEHRHLAGLLIIFPVQVPRPLIAAVERAVSNDRLRHIPKCSPCP